MTHNDLKLDDHGFRTLFERSPDPAWIIDGHQFVECNEAAIRTLGYASRHEFLNSHPASLSPALQPDGQDSYAKAERMMAIARDKGLHRFEWVHTRADGSNFIAEVKLAAMDLAHRSVIYCVWRDISAQKRVEEQLLRQNNMLTAIVDNFPGGISVFDADLKLAACNNKFKSLLDLPDSLFDKPEVNFEDLVRFNAERGDYGPGDSLQQVAVIVERARNFQPHQFERVRVDGTALDIRGMPLPDGGFVSIYLDITERKLADQQQRIAATAFESQEGMFVTDAARKILRVNRAFSDITGYSAAEAVGQTPRLLKSGRHDPAFYAVLSKSLEVRGIWQGEIWNRRKNGEVYPQWLMITAVKNEAQEVSNYVAALTDITARKQAEKEINSLAFYDPLTNLPNRRLLHDRVSQTMSASKRSGCFCALMILDLDHFKPINDAHGHAVGDLLLIEAANRLKNCVREIDTVARFGGDEFVVVLSDLSPNQAESVTQAGVIAEKIRLALAAPYDLVLQHDGGRVTTITHHCSASIGVLVFMDNEESQDDILKWADAAMYLAKEAGRNRVHFYETVRNEKHD